MRITYALRRHDAADLRHAMGGEAQQLSAVGCLMGQLVGWFLQDLDASGGPSRYRCRPFGTMEFDL